MTLPAKYQMPVHLESFQALIEYPAQTPARAWLNDKVMELVTQLPGLSYVSIRAKTYLDLMLAKDSQGLNEWLQPVYQEHVLATQKDAFVLFELTYSDDAFGEDLPVAVMCRLDEETLAKLNRAVSDVESGLYLALDLNMPSANMRWLSKLAFTSENGVAPIDGWFDPNKDEIIYAGDVAEMEMDGSKVDYADYCEVFSSEPVENQSIRIEKFRGEIYVAPHGATPQWGLNSMMERWSALQEHLSDAVKHTAVERQRA